MAGHALYRFYGDAGRLLYIGITDDPDRRWKQHAKSKDWWAEVRGITVDWYDTRVAVEAAEKRAVAVEQPVHNKALRRKMIVVPSVKPAPVPAAVGERPWYEWTDDEADFIDSFECCWTAHWWESALSVASPTDGPYRHDGRLYAEQPVEWTTHVLAMRRKLAGACYPDALLRELVREVYGRADVSPENVWPRLIETVDYVVANT